MCGSNNIYIEVGIDGEGSRLDDGVIIEVEMDGQKGDEGIWT